MMIPLAKLEIVAGEVSTVIAALTKLRDTHAALMTELDNNYPVTESGLYSKESLKSIIMALRVGLIDASNALASSFIVNTIPFLNGGSVLRVNQDGTLELNKVSMGDINFSGTSGFLCQNNGNNLFIVPKIPVNSLSNGYVSTKAFTTPGTVVAGAESNVNGVVTTTSSNGLFVSWNSIPSAVLDKLKPYIGSPPIGTIYEYIGTTAPAGYAFCDGSQIPTQYARLREMYGDRLPNCSNRSVRCVDRRTDALCLDIRTTPRKNYADDSNAPADGGISTHQNSMIKKHTHRVLVSVTPYMIPTNGKFSIMPYGADSTATGSFLENIEAYSASSFVTASLGSSGKLGTEMSKNASSLYNALYSIPPNTMDTECIPLSMLTKFIIKLE